MKLSRVKSYLLTGTAGFAVMPAIGMAGPANAADMPLKAPSAPVAAPSWAGFYIGLNIGGASEGSYFNDPNGTVTSPVGVYVPGWRHGGAVIGGGQIGYNWQNGNFVYGLEADFSGLSKPSGTYFKNTNVPGFTGCCTYGSHIPWMSTVRGRLGMTVGDGNTLLYGTGGLAVAEVKASTSEAFFGHPNIDYSKTRVGWAAGAGVQRMIAPHWIVGLEGLFADFGSYTKGAPGKCCARVHDNVLLGRLRVDYKF